MIEQRLFKEAHPSAKGMRIWFDKDLKITESNEWIFAEAPRAFAAIKVVKGSYTWSKINDVDLRGINGYKDHGRWAVFKDETSPFIIEVVKKKDFQTLSKFKEYIFANPVNLDENSVTYQSQFYQTKVKLFSDTAIPPEIDGNTVNFKTSMAYDSPFVRVKYKGNVLTYKNLQDKIQTVPIP